MTTKAKDGRETLQERLRARINKHIDPRGNVCVGQYNHWDSALDLDAIRDLDAAQAEIASLTKERNELVDALSYADLRASGGVAPLPAGADVVERAKKAFADVLGTFHSTSCYPKALPIEIDVAAGLIVSRINAAGLLRQPEADGRKGIAPDPITGQGDARSLTPEEDTLLRTALLSASQPEAAPEGLIRNAALQEAAAHLRDMGYWTQASAVLSLCTNASASAPTPASAVGGTE